MNIERLIELTQEYKSIENQINDLINRQKEIENQIDSMAGSGSSRNAKGVRLRNSKGGEEVDAYEELCLEYAKSKKNSPISTTDFYDQLGAKGVTDKSRVRCALTRLREKSVLKTLSRGVFSWAGNENVVIGPSKKRRETKKGKSDPGPKDKKDMFKYPNGRSFQAAFVKRCKKILSAMPKGKVVAPINVWTKLGIPHNDWKKWNKTMAIMAKHKFIKKMPLRKYMKE